MNQRSIKGDISMRKLIMMGLVACVMTGVTANRQDLTSAHAFILIPPAVKETRKWSWLGSLGALCSGVGVNGAYRVNVEAQAEKNPSGSLSITSMALWVNGAMVQKNNTTATAKFEVKKGDSLVDTVILSRPDPDSPSIETDPAAGESFRLYMPKATPTIEIPAGARMFFTVTAQIKLGAGTCVLGVSKEKVDPFVSTGP
jgi:hypothetical protein